VLLPSNYAYHFNVPFEEIRIPVNETDTISLLKFLPKDSLPLGVVIYFHGNMENINHYAMFASNFTQWGYEVWMEDYPGFGKSTGICNEKKLYKQAEQVYLLAASRFNKKQIVIYGKSFGTGIAAYLASVKNCRQLILESPYYSIPDLFSCYLPIYPTERMSKYKIPTWQYLQEVQVPVTLFEGTQDGVVPYRCASKLKDVLKPADEFVIIDKGTHHDLNNFSLFHQKLDSLLKP
jgi:alpha-beta hydrolase superfamily lysophospholipase